MTTIVVPLDGSSFSEAAIPVAEEIAQRRNGSICLVRVAVPETHPLCENELRSAAATVSRVPVHVQVVDQTLFEHVADAIVRTVRELPNAMLCITAHGRSGLGAAILGSTTEEVLRTIERPVLVVGPKCSPTWSHNHRLFIPLDGSEKANRILPYAASVTRAWHLEPWLVQVAHPFDTETAQNATHMLERPRAELASHGLDARTDLLWASNAPITLASEARATSAALILMSSHATAGAARTFLGSVTMAVIHRASCPVLVCPPEVLAGAINDPLEICISGR